MFCLNVASGKPPHHLFESDAGAGRRTPHTCQPRASHVQFKPTSVHMRVDGGFSVVKPLRANECWRCKSSAFHTWELLIIRLPSQRPSANSLFQFSSRQRRRLLWVGLDKPMPVGKTLTKGNEQQCKEECRPRQHAHISLCPQLASRPYRSPSHPSTLPRNTYKTAGSEPVQE
jgi:hypothetical protein